MHEEKTESTEFPVTFQSEGEIFHFFSIFLVKYFKLHEGEGEGETITELFI